MTTNNVHLTSDNRLCCNDCGEELPHCTCHLDVQSEGISVLPDNITIDDDDNLDTLFDGPSGGDDMYDYDNDGMTDVEADADTLRSAGWGTDEDYGYYGENEYPDCDYGGEG